jgi:hypothetical protein
MAETIQHKRGDTADWLLLLPDEEYADGYFIGWEIASEIRTSRGKLIASLSATWADPAETTRIIRLYADETTKWPLAKLECDVQFTRTADGFIRSSETFIVDVVRDVTLTGGG